MVARRCPEPWRPPALLQSVTNGHTIAQACGTGVTFACFSRDNQRSLTGAPHVHLPSPPSADSAALPAFGLPAQAATLESLFGSPAGGQACGGRGCVLGRGSRLPTSSTSSMAACASTASCRTDAVRSWASSSPVRCSGSSCQGKHRYTAEAVTPVRLRRTQPRPPAGHGRGGRAAAVAALTEILEEIRAAQQHIIVLGQLGAEERVAHFLVSAAAGPGRTRNGRWPSTCR